MTRLGFANSNEQSSQSSERSFLSYLISSTLPKNLFLLLQTINARIANALFGNEELGVSEFYKHNFMLVGYNRNNFGISIGSYIGFGQNLLMVFLLVDNSGFKILICK